jgi:hypothetical protein
MPTSTTIMLIITLAISIFLAYIKINDYLKYKKLLKEVSGKDVLVETVKRKGQRKMFYAFIGLTVGFLVILIFFSSVLGSFYENITYVVVFAILSVSEWCNYKTVDTLSIFEKNVVYSISEIRVKSIRTIVANGKKNANVVMLDGTNKLVPNDVAAKLTALQKARKAK